MSYTCPGTATANCTGSATARYRWLGHPEYTPLCAACLAVMERMGLHLVPEPEPCWVTRARERRLPAKVVA